MKDVNKSYVVIAWDSPQSDGGSPITKYVVEKRDVKRTGYSSAGSVEGDVFEQKVTKLVEGNEYFFQVFAENDIGLSEPATMSEPVKARLPFGMFVARYTMCCIR